MDATPGARNLLVNCAATQAGERLLIAYDRQGLAIMMQMRCPVWCRQPVSLA